MSQLATFCSEEGKRDGPMGAWFALSLPSFFIQSETPDYGMVSVHIQSGSSLPS